MTATSQHGIGSLGFQSQYTDPVTRLTEMGVALVPRVHWRDTVIVPPVPDPAAANTFAHVVGDPLGFTHPTGHYTQPGTTPLPSVLEEGLGLAESLNLYADLFVVGVGIGELLGPSQGGPGIADERVQAAGIGDGGAEYRDQSVVGDPRRVNSRPAR